MNRMNPRRHYVKMVSKTPKTEAELCAMVERLTKPDAAIRSKKEMNRKIFKGEDKLKLAYQRAKLGV